MKNGVLWVIIVILAMLLGFSVGYIVGDMNASQENVYPVSTQDTIQEPILPVDDHIETSSEIITEVTPSAVGSYKSDSWNGKSAALVLKADGTCLYPTGKSGTWTQEGTMIKITLNNGFDDLHVELVEGGVIVSTTFFEAVD